MIKDLKIYKYRILILFIIVLLIIAGFNNFFAGRLELNAYDFRAKYIEKEASPDIIIVGIDDRSIKIAKDLTEEGLGKYPWPRPTISKALKFISKCKPKAIVVDIAFEGNNRKYENPDFNDDLFIEDIKKIPDLFFIQRIKTNRSEIINILNFYKISFKKPFESITSTEILHFIINDKNISSKFNLKLFPESILKKFSYNVNLKNINIKEIQNNIEYYMIPKYINVIYESAKGIGINNSYTDIDDKLRKLKPIYMYNGKYLFVMSLAAAYFARGNNENVVLDKKNLNIGKTTIPLTDDFSFYLNWRKKTELSDKDKSLGITVIPQNLNYKTIPFIALLKYPDKVSPEIFKDKIVLLGATSNNFGDYYKVPNMDLTYGINIIATGIDNILNDDKFIKKLAPWQNYMITIFLAIVIIALFMLFPIYKTYFTALFYSLLVTFLFISANLFSFTKLFLWIDLVSPLFTSITTIVFCIAVSLMLERGKRSQVESTFSKYVSPQVYKTLLDSSSQVNLTATRKEVTVLFSDIRGFTPFVEDLTPEEVSKYINEYFTEMVEVILRNNGTIDKFIGDALMAFWGAPLADEEHALDAAKASLEMLEALDKLNDRWERQGRRRLNIGVGLNTGEVLVGNFGSPKLMDYTVMGDSVNLASRLESLNKEENTNILISAFTYQQIKDKVDVRIVGARKVKGKSQEVVVYELLNLK